MKFKRKILLGVLLVFVLATPILLTACGEQFIEKRAYQAINMQVIRDDTTFSGYSQFNDGEFSDVYCGNMKISKSIIDIKDDECVLYYAEQDLGVSASYTFKRYNDTTEYPAFRYESCEIRYQDENITNYTDEQLSQLEDKPLVVNFVFQFKTILESFDSSIQIATANKSLVAHIIMKDGDGALVLMAILYGY